MIDFRYHLVSLIAVFLAVALGIVIGTTQLNGGVLDNLQSQVTTLEQSKRALEGQTQILRAQADGGVAFEQAAGPALVRGALNGRSVLLVVASDKVAPETVQALGALIGQAGGAVSGTIRLQAKYTDPSAAPALQSYVTGSGLPAGVTLPATADTAKLTAALLGQVLMIPARGGSATATSAGIASVVSGLSSLGVLTADGPSVAPANSAIVLTAGVVDAPDADSRNAALVDLAAALDASGSGAVIAGDGTSTGAKGLVGVVRADRGASAAISTVDDIDVPAGQICGVLALVQERQGISGRYGSAKGAQPLPPLPTATP